MTEWIKCSDQLPDKNRYEKKLVFSKYEGICTARYNEDYWDLDPQGDHSTGGYLGEVTHWAELPQPPEDK